MTEKEKLAQGLLYEAFHDAELKKDLMRAKQLCFEFNQTPPSNEEAKQKIIKKLFKKCHGSFVIMPAFWCDYGYNIEVGDGLYINHNCVILDCAKVTFGANVLIGPSCNFFTAEHPLDRQMRHDGYETARPITIGDDVWFGGGCTVLPGVKIGDGTVVGAGSLVVKDLPSGVIAFGNPCRPIREITPEDKNKYPIRQKNN